MNKILMIGLILFGVVSGAETLGSQKDLTGKWRYTDLNTTDKKPRVTDLLVMKTNLKTGKDKKNDFYSVQSANQADAPVLGLSVFKNSKGDLILAMRSSSPFEKGTTHIAHQYGWIKEQKKDLIVLGGTTTEGAGEQVEIIRSQGEVGRLERIADL